MTEGEADAAESNFSSRKVQLAKYKLPIFQAGK